MKNLTEKQEHILKIVRSNKLFLEILKDILPDNEKPPMKQGKNGLILAAAKDDEGCKQLLNHHVKKVRDLINARVSVKSWGGHIKRVDNLMGQARARGGKIGAPLSFHSAHTGRWGGAEKINLQNLGGRGRAGAGTHPLIQAVRGMLTAPDGYIFGLNDYAQIQARILPWLAGQDDLVQGFANGEDIYSAFATELFKAPVRKPKETDPGPINKLLTIRRGFGKDAILGCGFGMGTNRFFERCRANNDLRPMFDSGEYNWDFVDKLIKLYRSRYPKIPAFWKDVEKAWAFVTKYHGQPSILGAMTFYHKDKATYIQLPSGRYLRYPGARVKAKGGCYGSDSLSYRWNKNCWGGFLTENIVQAVEVDIFGEALLRLERAGFNLVLHGHDEAVCLFKESEAEKKLEEMKNLMMVVPTWATGLPIAVEGELTKRYKK